MLQGYRPSLLFVHLVHLSNEFNNIQSTELYKTINYIERLLGLLIIIKNLLTYLLVIVSFTVCLDVYIKFENIILIWLRLRMSIKLLFFKVQIVAIYYRTFIAHRQCKN